MILDFHALILYIVLTSHSEILDLLYFLWKAALMNSLNSCLPFVWYFHQAAMYKKTEWYFFDQGEKWSQIGKTPPAGASGGRAEIENVTYAKSDIFNFNSATGWCYWTFTPLFPSMEHCQKKSIIQIFDTLIIIKIYWNFAPCISGMFKWTRGGLA